MKTSGGIADTRFAYRRTDITSRQEPLTKVV